MSEYIVRCKDITKLYNGKKVLDSFSMNVKYKDVHGFVGENGSGKTTIIRILTGLVHQNSGTYELFGKSSNNIDILKERKKIGAVVESPSIYLNLSAKDNMLMQGILVGNNDKNRHREIIELVGLGDTYDDKKKSCDYSLGMRQRLGIAMALLSNPELIILDEPMNGLDPEGIVEIRNLIIKLNKEYNVTFIISSHILTELELVATTYGIISHGRMINEISKEDLELESKPGIVLSVNDMKKAEALLKAYDYTVTTNRIVVHSNNINEIMKLMIDNDIIVTSIETKNGNIEDYYLKLIGGNNNA